MSIELASGNLRGVRLVRNPHGFEVEERLLGPSEVIDVLKTVFGPGSKSPRDGIGLGPDVGLDPSPAYVLQRQDKAVDIGMTLTLQWSAIRHTVFNVDDEAAARTRGFLHGPSERKKPFDVAVGVDARIRPSIGIGWAREEQVDHASWKL